MKPETRQYLRKAQTTLTKASAILAIGIADVAAREAYLAAFHAAEAYIFEQTGRAVKTHRGVRAEFARLARHRAPPLPVVGFLSRGYELKAEADYGLGEELLASEEDAAASNGRMMQELVQQRGTSGIRGGCCGSH